ncbi:hypothetical protein [Streptomyces alkaliterrae]|uniref:hypothetical protein n=1 Tax=Streptomyces alkaliterrae TaxID=2213162 RepID=UPI001E5534D4|nr:hypothetical protein [Streptomyces alkaliterrae]
MLALLFFLCAVFVVFCVPTWVVWRLGRRVRVPRWMLVVFLLAGWLMVSVGWTLTLNAQPFLFPETSPCHGFGSTPVTRYFPPDSFCRHADGELRTVNGTDRKLVFWTAAATAVAMLVGAPFARCRQPVGTRGDGGRWLPGHVPPLPWWAR